MAPRSAAASLLLAMSRHRAVRNLDLDEELNEDYGNEYDAIEDLSPEDQDAMDVALALRNVACAKCCGTRTSMHHRQ